MAIAHLSLVKAAIFGEDANWGRIMAAVGSCGVQCDLDRVELFLQGKKIFSEGQVCSSEKVDWQSLMQRPLIEIRILLHKKEASYTVWTSDLSYDYVKINSKYRT